MQRKFSATKLNSLCTEGEFVLIVEGTVIKSPPFGKMRNESSYKKRWMDLVRIDTQTETIHDPMNRRQSNTRKSSITSSIDGRTNSFDRTLRRSKRKSSTSSSTSSAVIEEQQESYYLIRYWNKWESKNKGLAPNKTIQLEKSFSVSIQEHPIFPEKYPHTFSLNTASRNYYVNADSEEMLNKWHTQIAEAIRQADKEYASIQVGCQNGKTSEQICERPRTPSGDSGNIEDIENLPRRRPQDIQLSHRHQNTTQPLTPTTPSTPSLPSLPSTPSTPNSPKDDNNNAIYHVLEEEKHSHIQFEDVRIEFPVGTQVDCSISDTITFVTENAKCVISKVVHV